MYLVPIRLARDTSAGRITEVTLVIPMHKWPTGGRSAPEDVKIN